MSLFYIYCMIYLIMVVSKPAPPLVFSLRFIVTLAPELQSVLTALFSLLKEKWKASISRLSQLQNRIAL